jgi:hypothetical protein
MFQRSSACVTAKSANFDKQKLEDSIKVIDCGSVVASPRLAAPSEGLANVVLKIQCNAPNVIVFRERERDFVIPRLTFCTGKRLQHA